MAAQTDVNGVLWDVRVVGGAFSATPDVRGTTTYTNTTGADVNDEPIGADQLKASVTWPAGGQPTVIGQSVKPADIVNAFAKANKGSLGARVTESAPTPTPAPANSPPPSTPQPQQASLLPLLALAVLIYYADN